MLEDFPEVGEKFSFENMDFEILAMDDLRVERVKVIINENKDEEDE
jgi:CBS domain containing-hemolysin-like protein